MVELILEVKIYKRNSELSSDYIEINKTPPWKAQSEF